MIDIETFQREFIENIKRGVERHAPTLPPGADFAPAVGVFDGGGMCWQAPIDPSFMEDAFSKDILAKMMGFYAEQRKLIGMALICAAWTMPKPASEEDTEKIEASGGVAAQPERIECVLIFEMGVFHNNAHCAEIERSETKSPILKRWRSMADHGVPTGVAGRFAEAVLPVLKHNYAQLTK